MTPYQISLARHALGLTVRKQSYRNRYSATTGTTNQKEWDALVSRGLAVRVVPRMIEYYLTPEGARAALEPGETLDPEDFPASTSPDDHSATQSGDA